MDGVWIEPVTAQEMMVFFEVGSTGSPLVWDGPDYRRAVDEFRTP